MSLPHESQLIGLLGHGVGVSLTPPMIEREAAEQGLPLLYRPIDTARLGYSLAELLQYAADLGFTGFNVTHPHKQEVLGCLDTVAPMAAELGAVNTVLLREVSCGYNTDVSGFGRGLRNTIPADLLGSVLQLGTGGAGSAIGFALLQAGVQQLFLADLDHTAAQAQACRLAKSFPAARIVPIEVAQVQHVMKVVDGFVQATPVGMAHHPGCPIDTGWLRPQMWVADAIYRPIDTELVRAARDADCIVMDGGHMAVGQAIDSFELFTGRKADEERMRRHFNELIATERAVA
ncbi:shikimate dehydrogenase [Micrococcoides hystricis]|uniref:Shikimate dehydrogenase n=1 Tax=Micrococcoides hystricis TaxID=1572761 RepID=A0ABV6PC73_9MICC